MSSALDIDHATVRARIYLKAFIEEAKLNEWSREAVTDNHGYTIRYREKYTMHGVGPDGARLKITFSTHDEV